LEPFKWALAVLRTSLPGGRRGNFRRVDGNNRSRASVARPAVIHEGREPNGICFNQPNGSRWSRSPASTASASDRLGDVSEPSGPGGVHVDTWAGSSALDSPSNPSARWLARLGRFPVDKFPTGLVEAGLPTTVGVLLTYRSQLHAAFPNHLEQAKYLVKYF